MSRAVYALFRAAFIVGATPIVSAQVPRAITDLLTAPGVEGGAPAGSYPLSGFDSINAFSGRLNFALPLLRVGGRGESGYTITLPIQTRWTVEKTTGGSTTYAVYPVWWWSSPIAYNPGTVRIRVRHEWDQCGSGIVSTFANSRITFVEPDGTEHELRDQKFNGQPIQVGTCINGAGQPGGAN